MEIASTLPPRDVAIMMIEHAVVKHRARYDHVFFKVRLPNLSPFALCGNSPLRPVFHSRHLSLDGWSSPGNHRGRFYDHQPKQPWSRQAYGWGCLSCGAYNVSWRGHCPLSSRGVNLEPTRLVRNDAAAYFGLSTIKFKK